MVEIIVYLFLLLLIIAFWVWELWLSKKYERRRFGANDLKQHDPFGDQRPFNAHSASPEDSEKRLVKVLGKQRYESMTNNLTTVLRRHEADEFITLSLHPARLTADSEKILHNLAPGDRLFLLRDESSGIPVFKIFASGCLVGMLSPSDASCVDALMEDSVIRGAYVWRQNCYGDCNFTDLDIVLFFDVRLSDRYAGIVDPHAPYRVDIEGLKPFTVYQN